MSVSVCDDLSFIHGCECSLDYLEVEGISCVHCLCIVCYVCHGNENICRYCVQFPNMPPPPSDDEDDEEGFNDEEGFDDEEGFNDDNQEYDIQQ